MVFLWFWLFFCQGIQAFFAGAATPATHPALYTASVAAAFEAYCEIIREDATPAPLLVNSHGWVTGATPALKLVGLFTGQNWSKPTKMISKI